MITELQEKYLAKLPDKTITSQPFDPKARETGEQIVMELRAKLPSSLQIHFWGSAALGIAGQNDIDIDIFSTPEDYHLYQPVIESLYGPPKKVSTVVRWEFKRNGFEVELFLTDGNSPFTLEQLKVFKLLSEHKELRDEYEQLKLPFGEQDFKQYMRKKYEFFNRILEIK